jgi:glycosyltransferase involved in cell wall biosynthesis
VKSVHQILIGAARNDAITHMAFEIREILRDRYISEIFSYHSPSADLIDEVQQISEMPIGTVDDKIIYHQSFGIPELTKFILQREEEVILHYHNVTPSIRYKTLIPSFAEALDYGREELNVLVSKVTRSFADSKFNAQELSERGYQSVSVLPVGLNVRRLDTEPVDPLFLSKLSKYFPNGYILFVSQVLPHKRVEHALAMMHLLRTVHHLDIGLVVAGPIRQPAYMYALQQFRSHLNDCHVLFTDAVSDSQLATLYRSCICYIGTSEHEGLSVPPLEAMSNLAPVIVRGAGAVPETVEEGGIVLDADVGLLEFTETVAKVVTDRELQSYLRRAGENRISEIDAKYSKEELSNSLYEALA